MSAKSGEAQEFIDSVYNADGAVVFRIELDRLEKFASGMCPTGRMHDVGAAHVIVSRVAVALEYALEVAQETPWTFPFPTHPEVEHHHSARLAVLPQIGLVIFATHGFG